VPPSVPPLQGFAVEDREVVEKAKDFNSTCRTPHLRFDDPPGICGILRGSSLFLLGRWDVGMRIENMGVIEL
jgi:hypothetical protein